MANDLLNGASRCQTTASCDVSSHSVSILDKPGHGSTSGGGKGWRRHFTCKFIISYSSKFKILWDWFVLVLVIFTAIQVPYMAAFPSSLKSATINSSLLQGKGLTNTTVLLGLLVDCMFVLDILINFRTTYLKTDTDVLVTNPKRIAFHYLKSWFCIDFLAAIPFDWFISSGPNQKDETATLIGLLKSARLLRLFRVARKLDRYSEYGIAVLLLLMCLFTLIGHWLACGWHAVGNASRTDPNGWVHRFQVANRMINLSNVNVDSYNRKKYISALYFVMTSLTSVGFGNIAANTEPEQVFTILVMLLGALMYACIFGNMVAIVQRLYLKTSTFHSEMNTIKEFIKFYRFPDDLTRKIQTHARHEWTISEGVSSDKVLRRFPESLQSDICYEIYNDLFASIPAFSYASVGCMRAMARKFKTCHLQAGHFVLRQGDEVQGLYVLQSGLIEILRDESKVGELSGTCLFGYNFVTKPRIPKANACLRAANTVKIHSISKKDMLHVLKFYPNFSRQFKRHFHPRYEICNEVEEGLQRTIKSPRHQTVSSLARSMMKLSFISKLSKSKSQRTNNTRENSANGASLIGISEEVPAPQTPVPSLEMSIAGIEMSEMNPWTEYLPGEDESEQSDSSNSERLETENLKREIENLKEQLTLVNQTVENMKNSLTPKIDLILTTLNNNQPKNLQDMITNQRNPNSTDT